MTIDNEELSDNELFEGAVSEEPVEEQVIEDQPGQARDEAGRFAGREEPKQEVVAEQLEKPAADDDAAQVPSWRVPSWRVREIREERDALRRQLDEARRQPTVQPRQEAKAENAEAPDPLLDPAGYAKHVRDEIRNDLLSERREESLQKAAEAHPEEFADAYKAAQQAIDPALRARMQSSRDPGKTLLEWHRENKTRAEVGNDLNAYKQRLRDEALKDPDFLAKAIEAARATPQTQSNGRPRVELPPSLNGLSRSNAALKAAPDDVSDEQLFSQLTG